MGSFTRLAAPSRSFSPGKCVSLSASSGISIQKRGYNFDPLTPLVGWVEAGIAPDRIVGEVSAGPQAGRTFLLCLYPSLAVYQRGEVNDAANWVCKAHTNHRFRHKGNWH